MFKALIEWFNRNYSETVGVAKDPDEREFPLNKEEYQFFVPAELHLSGAWMYRHILKDRINKAKKAGRLNIDSAATVRQRIQTDNDRYGVTYVRASS